LWLILFPLLLLLNLKKKKKDRIYQQQLEEIKIYQAEHRDKELEYLQKMNDPLWHYYDDKEEKFKVLEGEYGRDCPPGRAYLLRP